MGEKGTNWEAVVLSERKKKEARSRRRETVDRGCCSIDGAVSTVCVSTAESSSQEAHGWRSLTRRPVVHTIRIQKWLRRALSSPPPPPLPPPAGCRSNLCYYTTSLSVSTPFNSAYRARRCTRNPLFFIIISSSFFFHRGGEGGGGGGRGF